jgi:hypothetical protein
MITVADPQLETEYAANFDEVFAHGHAVKPTDPNSVPPSVLEPADPDAANHSRE